MDVDQVTAVEPGINSALTCYPNPVNDKLKINGYKWQAFSKVKAVTSGGWEFELKADSLENDTVVDVANLPQGMYFLRIEEKGNVIFLRKVIKE